MKEVWSCPQDSKLGVFPSPATDVCMFVAAEFAWSLELFQPPALSSEGVDSGTRTLVSESRTLQGSPQEAVAGQHPLEVGLCLDFPAAVTGASNP